MPVEVIEVARWQSAESVAAQLQQGRVFLVGDAAHTMPAYKGLGANTAIQSAQNLGWKLGAVIRRVEMSGVDGRRGGTNEGGGIGAVRCHEHNLGHSLAREVVEMLDDGLKV